MGDQWDEGSSDEDLPVAGASTMAGAGDDDDLDSESEDDMSMSAGAGRQGQMQMQMQGQAGQMRHGALPLAGSVPAFIPGGHVFAADAAGASPNALQRQAPAMAAGATQEKVPALKSADAEENRIVKKRVMYTLQASLNDLQDGTAEPYMTCASAVDVFGEDDMTVYDVKIVSFRNTSPVSLLAIAEGAHHLTLHQEAHGVGGTKGLFSIPAEINQVVNGDAVMTGSGESVDSHWLFRAHPGLNKRNLADGMETLQHRPGTTYVAANHPVITVMRALAPGAAAPAGAVDEIASVQADDAVRAIGYILDGTQTDDKGKPINERRYVSNLKDLRFKVVRAMGEPVIGGAPDYTDTAEVSLRTASKTAIDGKLNAQNMFAVELEFECRRV